ncbi:MAG: type II toxin-antitoxin system VapB family antitoxin [Candidatus Accumulibacter sp.]|nr:type II toxin-antitoxin system VapB family antitoxin [Accumulibacter sp.]
MKTTVEIPSGLFAEAKRYAKAEHTTLKALVEMGLRRVLADEKNKPAFKLRDESVGGHGLTPEFRNASWEHIRDAVYGRRDA